MRYLTAIFEDWPNVCAVEKLEVFFSHYRERSMKHLKNTKGGFTGLLVVIRQGEIVGDPEPEDLLLGSLWKLLTTEDIEGARRSAERHVGAFVVIDREAPVKRPPLRSITRCLKLRGTGTPNCYVIRVHQRGN